jgi:acetyl-CoA decarbonylase/synthase complex subunit gamma
MSKTHISPIDVYRLLPMTNCKACGDENCMAFATKLVNREVNLDACPPLLEAAHRAAYEQLWALLKPPVREVVLGSGERTVKIGGKLVMYRHELNYANPTAIAIDVTDEMEEIEFIERLKAVEDFSYRYIGQDLRLDLVALRSTSNDPKKFGSAAKKLEEATNLPVVLCSTNPEVVENGLLVLGKRRPLVYAATQENWREMADLAMMYRCPLVVAAPNTLTLLKSLTKTLVQYGVDDLVLDPGTFPGDGVTDTVNAFTIVRRAACKEGDDALGFPVLGTPIAAWSGDEAPEVAVWKETLLAAMQIVRFADILILHNLEGWSLLPVTVLRNNMYTDPRKPVAVEAGLRTFGEPGKHAPVMFTTNFALTYYTVASDIEAAQADCHLLVVDTEGLSVESSVAGRKLTADKVAEALKESKVEGLVDHRKLIIPGRASRLSGEIAETTGWEVVVGPLDSSGIPKLLSEL